MKKITILFAMALLLGFPLVAMSAEFGKDGPVGTISDDLIDQSIIQNYKTSTNVGLEAEADNAFYKVAAAHLNGTRQFGSSSEDSQIFWKDKEKGTTAVDLPNVSGSNIFLDKGWSAL